MTEQEQLRELVRTLDEKLRMYYETILKLQREIEQKNEVIAKKTRLEALGQLGAMLAHEIRNPLGGIELYCSVLKRDLEPSKQELVDKILNCVRDLNQLVTDILTFTGNIVLQKGPQAIEKIVEEAVALSQDKIAKKNIRVVRHYTVNGRLVMVDPFRMQQVFLNIVQNAVDAMDSGGTLSIETRTEGDSVVVSFRDTGQGLAPEDLRRLFTPFFTTKSKGTGLGLAIAQRIVEAHGGRIEASNNPDRGACFTVRL